MWLAAWQAMPRSELVAADATTRKTNRKPHAPGEGTHQHRTLIIYVSQVQAHAAHECASRDRPSQRLG